MKKVSILGLHLGFGGVEQAIVNLANMLCEKYQVELAITYQVLDEAPYKIDSRVKVRYLTNLKPNKEELKVCLKEKKYVSLLKEGMKSLYILKMRTSVMKKYIKQTDADVLISSRVLYTELVSKYAKKGVITMAQEHCHHNNNEKYIKKLKKACRGIEYLIPVSKELTEFYDKRIQNKRTKCLYIPNSLEYWPEEQSKLNEKNLISIGRISPEKGFLDLIDVFDIVHQKFPEWHLHIIGDGVEMQLLKQRIKALNLTDSVVLHGFQKKEFIYKQLLHASIYVMGSFEESFGIVLLEAASFGIPLIAFDSAQGAHEIIEENQNGYLIEGRKKEKMAEKIEDLIIKEDLRKELGKKAKESVQKYSFEVVKEQWLKFLSSLEDKA